MRLALIAALASNRVIGRQGSLPWRLPEDLKRFKRLTLGHPVIMGRKTWESLPKKPLPERRNLVLSKSAAYQAEGAEVFSSLDECLGSLNAPQAFIIGGEALFKEALAFAGRLHLTLIKKDFEGDAFFPEFNPADFEELFRERHEAPEGFVYEFVDYQRRRQA